MDFATQNTPGASEDVHLYVGNLSPRVTEYMLTETFAATGAVQHLKIIPDRNYQHGGLNYALVKYFDIQSAKTAVQTLNGLKLFDTEIQVSWANQIQQDTRDAPGQYRVVVGDLSPEVNDDILRKAFSAFSSLSDARVIWDLQSGKSRGHGFLIFSDKTDAEQAIATMNGDWLGSRAITVSWANQKPQGSSQNSESVSYESILLQAPPDQTTVYIGNLVPYCTQADLIPIFQSLGYLKSIEMHADQGHASVHLDTHEHAAMAICQLHGQMVHGRPIKSGVCTEKDSLSSSIWHANFLKWKQNDALSNRPLPDYGNLQAPGIPPPTSSAPGQHIPGLGDPVSYYTQNYGGYYPQQRY